MICIKNNGRFGNQLFIYAFSIIAAQKLNTTYCIEFSKKQKSPQLYQYIQISFIQKLKNRILPHLFFHFFKNTTIEIDHHPTPQIFLETLTDNTFYVGYFQTNQYYFGLETFIKEKIKIKPKLVERFLLKYSHLLNGKPLMVMHARRGDYVNEGTIELGGKNLILPIEYYQNFLSEVTKIRNEYQIVAISDDVDGFKNSLPNDDTILFLKNEEIEDFLLMTHAAILCISNSSFAWWAAFLNKTENKKIYVPEFWMGFKVNREFPPNIIPNNWIKLSCK